MDEARQILAKKYEKIKITVSISEGVASFVLLILFIAFGYSKELERFSFGYTANPYLALLIFGLVLGLGGSILSLPVDFVLGFRLEHRFGLSNQKLTAWFTDKLKAALVGAVIGAPIGFLFYYLLSHYALWWLYLACIVWVYSILLMQIAPVLIFPIFYKFKPIENEVLKEKITKLCEKAGFKIKGVYTFDMSKNTKKANAAFTGLGKSRRIILGDTLISGFSEDEIETVFAHELGHYELGHIRKNILVSIFSTFLGLFVMAQIYLLLLHSFGFANRWEIGAIPLLAVIASVWSLLTMPIWAAISRKFEYEADRFAVDTTGNFEAFKSTMEKLAFQNLSTTEPNKLVEFWSHSHPSVTRRIARVEEYFRKAS